jgi:hypothetical protein
MTDPERLLRTPENALATLLLRAGAEEKPSAAVAAAKSAGIAAIRLAEGTSTAATGSAAFKGATLGVGAVVKWIAIGALGGAVAVTSMQALVADPDARHAGALPAAAPNALAERPSERATSADHAAPKLVVSADANEPERPIAVEAPRSRSSEPSLGDFAKPEATGRASGAFLAAEVRFVDQGRAAIQRGAFAEALEQLARYEELFPHQQLLTEVLFLRMEAFNRLGNVERARALAARILTLGVAGRQAAQAREVLGH